MKRKPFAQFDEPLQRLAVEMRSKSGQIEWVALKKSYTALISLLPARSCEPSNVRRAVFC